MYELGRLEIHRATNIEFTNATQHWEVRDRKEKVRLFSRSRSACLLLNQTGFYFRDLAVDELVCQEPRLIEAFDLPQPPLDR